jgi:hypothetical protein
MSKKKLAARLALLIAFVVIGEWIGNSIYSGIPSEDPHGPFTPVAVAMGAFGLWLVLIHWLTFENTQVYEHCRSKGFLNQLYPTFHWITSIGLSGMTLPLLGIGSGIMTAVISLEDLKTFRFKIYGAYCILVILNIIFFKLHARLVVEKGKFVILPNRVAVAHPGEEYSLTMFGDEPDIVSEIVPVDYPGLQLKLAEGMFTMNIITHAIVRPGPLASVNRESVRADMVRLAQEFILEQLKINSRYSSLGGFVMGLQKGTFAFVTNSQNFLIEWDGRARVIFKPEEKLGDFSQIKKTLLFPN